jgi:hypothetical protein
MAEINKRMIDPKARASSWSKMATDLTTARVVQAGAVPIDTYAVLAGLMSTWNRPDAMEFARIMVDHIVPPCRALMELRQGAGACRSSGAKPGWTSWILWKALEQ